MKKVFGYDGFLITFLSQIWNTVWLALDVTAACEAVFGRPEGEGTVLLSVSVSTDRLEQVAAFLEFLSQYAPAA